MNGMIGTSMFPLDETEVFDFLGLNRLTACFLSMYRCTYCVCIFLWPLCLIMCVYVCQVGLCGPC